MVARGRKDPSTWQALIEDALDDAAQFHGLTPQQRPTLRLHQRGGPLGQRVLVSEFDPLAGEVVFHLDDVAACVDHGWAEATPLVRFLAHHELGHAAELVQLSGSGFNPYLHRVDRPLEQWWQIERWANLRMLSHALTNGLLDYAVDQRLAQAGILCPLSIEMVLGDLLRRVSTKPDQVAYLVRRDFLAHFNRVLFSDRSQRADAQRLQELLQRVVGPAQWGWVAAAVQGVHLGDARRYEDALPQVVRALFPELRVTLQALPRDELPPGTALPKAWDGPSVRFFHWQAAAG